jgi:hypothetical protein
MARLLCRLAPGAALLLASAAVTVIALRAVARWRGEREWADAWEAYRQANR